MIFAIHKSILTVLGKYILNIKLRLRQEPHFYLALLAYVLISLLGMIYSPLFDEDEGFFAEAACNMLQTGDFFSTWINAEARFNKPDLYF
jgi:4-amino-4-deoxy-L-arabinose transferase-like glycosyltransferase